MHDSIFSEHWYRVAQLKPALRKHALVLKHRYRAEDWWIIRDPVTNRQHRLSPTAHFLVMRMDGDQTVQAIWDDAMQTLGEQAPTQDDLVELMGQLHNVDLLRSDANPDAGELFRRHETNRKQRRRQTFANPLFMRFSLFDPDRMLRGLVSVGRCLFTRSAFVIWALVMAVALVLTVTHFDALLRETRTDLLSPGNLAVLWCVYPLMKLVHELGHALAVKRWGDEVHDIGIMLMVLLPIPYVDASAASAFPDKYKRMVVGGIGIMIEATFAAIALFAWLALEPGLIRQIAFDVLLIGGVSTVLFNGNPLLRFDGYYVLSDYIEIPNLAGRAKGYLRFLMHSLLFGESDRESPTQSNSERTWLIGYGIASFVYRVLILLLIALYLSSTFLIAGVVLSLWVLFTQLGVPFAKGVAELERRSKTLRQRLRVYGTTTVTLGAVWTVLFALPFPSTTAAEGVVWLADRSVVRAGTDCFVTSIPNVSGSHVRTGMALAECADPELLAQAEVLNARIKELQHQYRGFGLKEQVRRKMLADEITALTVERDLFQERIAALTIKSATDGTFLIRDSAYLPGRFLRQGDVLGFVKSESALTIRTAVDQANINVVREGADVIEVRLASAPHAGHAARVQRYLPAAASRLPSAALGTMGGGDLIVDHSDDSGLLLDEEVFLVDLALPKGVTPARIGERAHVLFRHESEVLADQWGRNLRLLFLRHFNV